MNPWLIHKQLHYVSTRCNEYIYLCIYIFIFNSPLKVSLGQIPIINILGGAEIFV